MVTKIIVVFFVLSALIMFVKLLSKRGGSGKFNIPEAQSKQNTTGTNVEAGFVDTSEFYMPITDVFEVFGRGIVVTGKIQRGAIRVGEEVNIVDETGAIPTKKTVVTGIEAFKKTLKLAQTGENVGLVLDGIKREEIKPGLIATKN